MGARGVGDYSYPAKGFAAVTPSNTANLSSITRALYIGTGGDAVIVDEDDSAITFKNLASGQLLPVRAKRVNSTSTTATDIVALY